MAGTPRWRELTVPLPDDASPSMIEALFHLFDEGGAPGAEARDGDSAVVTYLPEDERADETASRLRQGLADLPLDLRCGPLELHEATIEETDWAEAWRQFFRPRRVGRRLVICPTWEDPGAGPEEIVITLDPGQAFGTGEHPTTRMMLELLERRLTPGDRVYDIGVGSGILSIAALKLGASRVVASDLQPVSIRAAADNLARNGVADRAFLVLGNTLAWLRAPADLIMTNIISATVIRFAPGIARLLRSGGVWIASGVMQVNEAEVRKAIKAAGMEVVERMEEGEWVAMAARR